MPAGLNRAKPFPKQINPVPPGGQRPDVRSRMGPSGPKPPPPPGAPGIAVPSGSPTEHHYIGDDPMDYDETFANTHRSRSVPARASYEPTQPAFAPGWQGTQPAVPQFAPGWKSFQAGALN